MGKRKPVEDCSRAMWQFLIYPDSCGFDDVDDLWRALEELMVPLFVSPLHDRDVKEDGSGELKKPHWHVLAAYDGPVPYGQCLYTFAPFGVKILKFVPSRRACERYWAHLDSKDKYKYDVADCKCFSSYEPKYLEDEYGLSGIQEIHDVAERLGIVYYADLANEIITHYPNLVEVLLRHPAHFNNFCYSRERMCNRDNTSYVKSRKKGLGRGNGD